MSGIFKSVKGKLFTSGGKEMESWQDISDSIIDVIKTDAGEFWDANGEAKSFVTGRVNRLAKLTWEYKTASDDTTKAQKKEQMEVVSNTIATELGKAISTAQTEINGSGRTMPLNTFTADVTITDLMYTVAMDATAGNLVPTLPPAAGRPGKIFIIKRQDNVGGNTVTLTPDGSDQIDALASVLIAVLSAVAVQSDGVATWVQIGAF